MTASIELATCTGCRETLKQSTRRAQGGWSRSPGGDEFFDELHCCSQCGAWSMVTFVDRFAVPDEIKMGGPLTTEEVEQQRVGCELELKPLLAADTSHGSAFPNDSRPGKRSYGL